MIKLINDFKESERWLDERFPDRHKVIHKTYCEKCPSRSDMENGVTDPETEDMRALPKEIIARECLFVCYCRQNKLCKGICETFEIDQNYLDGIYANTPAHKQHSTGTGTRGKGR